MFVKDGSNYRYKCKVCKCKEESERRKLNQEKYKEKDRLYYQNNKETILQRNKEYNDQNRNAICEQKRQYYNTNKTQILEYHQRTKQERNERIKLKRQNDALTKISESLKVRIHDVLKNKKGSKSNELIGCSKDELKEWLESQFTPDITWNNYGSTWHIDHVVPISFFDLTTPETQRICFNWTNLRPLDSATNMSKSNKIIIADVVNHISVLKTFPRYQANFENSWWRRIELRYGNNPQDEKDFIDLLKWAIRSQADVTGNVQRLNGSGSDVNLQAQDIV